MARQGTPVTSACWRCQEVQAPPEWTKVQALPKGSPKRGPLLGNMMPVDYDYDMTNYMGYYMEMGIYMVFCLGNWDSPPMIAI